MALNAALTNGTREYQSQPRRERVLGVSQSHRRVRFEALLARLRSRQLDLAMRGKVEESALYAQRATVLTQHIVIVNGIADMNNSVEAVDSSDSSDMHVDEPMLACCGV